MATRLRETIAGAYDTYTYSVDYAPTTGGHPVTDHRWVVHEEIRDAGDRGDVGRVGVHCECADAQRGAQCEGGGGIEADGACGSPLEHRGCDHAGDGEGGDDDARVRVGGPAELGLVPLRGRGRAHWSTSRR